MGQLILDQAVQAITDAGIPARRGYPSGKMGAVSVPVCAVNLKSADMRSKKLTVAAAVLSPADLGASVCEEAALTVGEILGNLGGKCAVAGCRADGRTGLYTAQITAEFNSEVPKITIDGVARKHVLAFTSWRTLDEEVTDWVNAKWNFRLEEYFPVNEEEETDPEDGFTLVQTSAGGTESYIGSTWTYQRRDWDASGVRQIRMGVADYTESG